jgi:hypothetical protein
MFVVVGYFGPDWSFIWFARFSGSGGTLPLRSGFPLCQLPAERNYHASPAHPRMAIRAFTVHFAVFLLAIPGQWNCERQRATPDAGFTFTLNASHEV